MKYSEAQQGRVFAMRLEDGDIVHEVIEKFARDKNIQAVFWLFSEAQIKGVNLTL